jgi:hypothetical protein
MSFLILLLAHLSFSYDPVALVENPNIRTQILNEQNEEIMRRVGLNTTDCSILNADLPFYNQMIPFHMSTAIIEQLIDVIHNYYPQECIREIAQNLSVEPDYPASDRIISELLSQQRSFFNAPKIVACKNEPSGIEAILGLTQQLQTVEDCSPLSSSRVWKRVKGRTAAGQNVDYSLVREGPGKVKAAVNINFQRDAGASVSPQEMLNRTRNCLGAVKGKLKGPNGDSLSIEVLTNQESAQIPENIRPSSHTINIMPDGFRSNWRAYDESVDCPTIVHEVLHLLGLCDEYPADQEGFMCRPVGKRNNVMRNQLIAFNEAVDRTVTCKCETADCRSIINDPAKRNFILKPDFYRMTSAQFRNNHCSSTQQTNTYVAWSTNLAQQPQVKVNSNSQLRAQIEHLNLTENGQGVVRVSVECSCEQNNADCRQALKELVEGNVPAGTDNCPYPTVIESNTIGCEQETAQVQNGKLVIPVKATKDNLLEPRQFNRILNGICPTQSQGYNECSQYAYETDANKCMNAPEKCYQTDWGTAQ